MSKEIISKLEWNFRQTILNSQVAIIGNREYCIHHLNNLEIINPQAPWEKSGIIQYEAQAEFFFVPIYKNGVFISTGERIIFKGAIERENDNFLLRSPLIIEKCINTSNIKKHTI